MYDFNGKSIYFLGDSITEAGGFIRFLRAHFLKKGVSVSLHNKGVPGARLDMVKFWLDEEFEGFTPDYAVVAYGVNDLRIGLYDAGKPVTDETAKDRQYFIDVYSESLPYLIKNLKGRGITPIVCSPFCVNQNIVETGNVQTVVDNQDKKEIKDTFYTQKTFRDINSGLMKMRDIAREVCQNLGVKFIDAYAKTLEAVTCDCFCEDGIHYTEKGHRVIAEILLKETLIEPLLHDLPLSNYAQIEGLEFEERAYYFIKYLVLHERLKGSQKDEDLLAEFKIWLAKNGNVDGVTKEREIALYSHVDNHAEKQTLLIKKIILNRPCKKD